VQQLFIPGDYSRFEAISEFDGAVFLSRAEKRTSLDDFFLKKMSLQDFIPSR
jgi:hypothetical protein